jgi:hypothetical protein
MDLFTIDGNLILGFLMGVGVMFFVIPFVWHYQWHDVMDTLGVHLFYCRYLGRHYWVRDVDSYYRHCLVCEKKQRYKTDCPTLEQGWKDIKEEEPES